MNERVIKLKILYVTTISNTMNTFLIPHIRSLVESGHQVDLAFNIIEDVSQELIDLGCISYDMPFQRSPLKTENLTAYKKLKKTLEEGEYELVHTHTPIASFITRMACRNNNKIKVAYTSHGFHFFKGAPLKNWMIFYTAEKFAARYTDLIVTINQEDYKRAKNSFKAKKIEYIPGIGFDIEKYRNVTVDKEEKRKSLGVSKDDFVVVSVGELNNNKNHKRVIEAIAKLHDDSIKYLICGQGPLKDELEKLIDKLNQRGNIILEGQRKDLPEIYNISDICVFPSKREGLGLAALEAMASGLPIVTSNIHGIRDYSIEGVTGFLCDSKDSDCFAKSIKKLKDNPVLRAEMAENNRNSVDRFELKNAVDNMARIQNRLILGTEEYE